MGLVLACALGIGCQAGAALGVECARASDCASPLTCAYGRCRAECVEARDCGPGLRCIETGAGGACTLSQEEHCTPSICASPLVCVDDRCRSPCTSDANCLGGSCVSGTCAEAVQRPMLTRPPTRTPASCDTSAWASYPELSTAILGEDRVGGMAGLELLAPHVGAPFDAPRVGTAFHVPQIALAARYTDADGELFVGYLENGVDGTGPFERYASLYTLPVDDLTRLSDPALQFPGFDVVNVRWLDVASDGDVFVAVATRDTPPPVEPESAWMLELAADGTTTIGGIRPGTPPRDEPSPARIVGGRTSFDRDVLFEDAWPLFYVFRENDAGAPWVGSVDRALSPPPNYVDFDTTTVLPDDVVDTAGGAGPMWLARRPSGEIIGWDQRRQDMMLPPTVRRPALLATGASGPVSIAGRAGDRVDSMIAFPSGTSTVVVPLTCGLAGTSDCTLGDRQTLASLTGGVVREVSIRPIARGFAIATVEETPGGGPVVPLRFVYVDGREGALASAAQLVPIFDASEVATQDEEAVAFAFATAPSARGVVMALAVLLRDERAERDRIFVGGMFACTL